MKNLGVFRNSERTVKLVPGEVLFTEGELGTEMFGVISGAVELRSGGAVIATLGVDETFGEMAIVDSSPRMATAVAAEDTELAVISKSTFLFLVHETPMFALQVMSSMADRLRHRT